MAGRRALYLILLIIITLEDASAKRKGSKKKPPCRYKRKRYQPGEVILSPLELRCSIKGRKTQLTLIKDCTCCTEPPTTQQPTICDYSIFDPTHSKNLPEKTECGAFHKTGVTSDDIKIILDTHNKLRAKVANGQETLGDPGPQHGATNMREMRWNTLLAEVAQAWAEQCPNFANAHDAGDNRRICDPDYYVGQNIFYQWSFNPNSLWESAVESWYSEVKDMPSNLAAVFARHDKVIGHYTQIVWAETYEVGCGAIYYDDFFDGDLYPQSKIYVCNYGPGGNILETPVYENVENGKPAASNCPGKRTSSTYPGLCALPT